MATPVLVQIILAASLFNTVKGQLSIDKTSIEDGGTYTMTCEASRLSTQNVNYISALTLDRISGAVITNIATYTPFPPPDLKNTSEQAGGRRWNFQFIGGVGTTTPSNNKATIKIILVVSDGLCSDAGTYRCDASFASSTVEDRKNITAQAKIEDPKIVSSHHIGNDLAYSLNEIGENITLTCSVLTQKSAYNYSIAWSGELTQIQIPGNTQYYTSRRYFYPANEKKGPPNLNLTWLYGPRGAFNFEVYPYTNDVKETSGPSGGSCTQYRHESALNLMVETNDIMYICVVKVNNQQEVGRANFTIGAHESGSSTKASGGNPNSGISSGVIDHHRLIRNMSLGMIAIFLCLKFC